MMDVNINDERVLEADLSAIYTRERTAWGKSRELLYVGDVFNAVCYVGS